MAWIMHSVLLHRERAAKPLRGDDLEAIQYELKIREFVLKHIKRPDMLTGCALIWHWWMVCHATLQIQRHQREIEEWEFAHQCKCLRDIRNTGDRLNRGVSWLRKDKRL
jgi:hypothetical protein